MLIWELAIILVASKVAGDLSVRLGQPAVLGKLLIGVVLGPKALGFVTNVEVLSEISQIGVLLLMFIAGLETDLEEFKRTGKAAVYVGVLGIAAPLLFGYLAGSALRLSNLESWFLGLLLSATSVSISVQVLKELGKLQSREGAVILGAAIIDDILVIVALAFLMSLLGQEVSLSEIVLKKVAFFSGAILLAWKVIPWLMPKFAPLKIDEAIVSGGLIICFSFAYFAEYAGVAAIIGAYISGIGVGLTKYKHEVFEKVETISYAIFVPVFFTLIGFSVDLIGLGKQLDVILSLSALAILTKLIGGAIGAKFAGFEWRSSFGIGAGMVSRGEVALIIAGIGMDTKLLGEKLFSAIIIVVLITTIITPLMMKWLFNK